MERIGARYHVRMAATRRPPKDQEALADALEGICTADYGRLRAAWLRLARDRKGNNAEVRAKLEQRIARSRARRAARSASVPELAIDPELPIANHAEALVAAIRKHQVVIVAGETGSGKTTQLPKLCLAAGRGAAGMIGCTQPRRLAARSVATRVASELDTELGGLVGFQVRFSERVGETSLIKFMTDGILLAETQGDRWLSAYDTLIIDEAHERSLNIDFLLGYLKQLLPRRPDLKLLVTSATIDTERFSQHFDGAPVIEVEGRGYPVELRWRPSEEEQDGNLAELVAKATEELLAERGPRGDVLVFLPGEREIRDAHLKLSRRNLRHVEVLPLYARLSAAEQDRVFRSGSGRRVVLATNVAETSLTVPGIRYVIDTGTARVKRYSPRRQVEQLRIESISQAAANQRMGRCGRIGPGICVRLYSEADFASRDAFTDPELLRSSLANVILRMLALGLGDIAAFPFLDPPEPRAIGDGQRRLAELSAIDQEQRLTAMGRELARWPIDVQLARMLAESERFGVLDEVLVVVAFLSVQDPRERPADARDKADAAHARFADPKSDFLGMLKLWEAFRVEHEERNQSGLRRWCKQSFLSYIRMREWRELHRQLLLVARKPGNRAPVVEAGTDQAPESRRGRQPDAFEKLHCSLLSGLPTQVARKDEKGLYRGTRGRNFRLFPGSALSKSPPQWLFAAQILDFGDKVFGLFDAAVDPRWIEQQAAHLVKRSWQHPHWSRQRGAVVADEQVGLFGLPLVERRTVVFRKQDPDLAHAIFVRDALVRCDIDCRAGFVAANASVLAEADELESRERRRGLLREDDELAGFFAGKIPGDIADARALDAWYRKLDEKQRQALQWQLEEVLESDAGASTGMPPELTLDGMEFPLHYHFAPGDPNDGITLELPLAQLNALPAARCEWLVPGLVEEKVTALIRGLPKSLRRNFVPAPEFARAFVEAEQPCDQALTEVLAAFLQRTTGVALGAADFVGIELPVHLHMRFALQDDQGRELAASRNLAELRDAWQGRARKAFSRVAAGDWGRDHVAEWPAESIPEQLVEAGRPPAWPALVAEGAKVALRVFERQELARAAHPTGVRKLLADALAADQRKVAKRLPLKPDVALKLAPLGTVQAMRDEIVQGAFADLLAEADLAVRDGEGFARLREQCARELNAAAINRLQAIEPLVAARAELMIWLGRLAEESRFRASHDELQQQLADLLAEGFASRVPVTRLAQFPRYLEAMRIRAEHVLLDPERDRRRQAELAPSLAAWRALVAQGGDHEALARLRWMLEEWRVSLFAQQLGTAEPVSAKRVARALKQAERVVAEQSGEVQPRPA